jgi:hypothetical protein
MLGMSVRLGLFISESFQEVCNGMFYVLIKSVEIVYQNGPDIFHHRKLSNHGSVFGFARTQRQCVLHQSKFFEGFQDASRLAVTSVCTSRESRLEHGVIGSDCVEFRKKTDAAGLHWKAANTGVAAHEGQLFGIFNQLLGLFTAMGLLLLSVSAVVLWWRRRAVGVLGAPIPTSRPRFSWALAALILAFGIYLPMLGISLIFVLLTKRFVLRNIPAARQWLGLSAA